MSTLPFKVEIAGGKREPRVKGPRSRPRGTAVAGPGRSRRPRAGEVTRKAYPTKPRRSASIRSIPLSFGDSTRIPHIQESDVETGYEFYKTVTVPSGTSGPVIVAHWYINPMTMTGRIPHMAQLWDRFEVLKLGLNFKGTQPATVGGQIVMWFDNDINDPDPTGDEILAQAAAHPSQSYSRLWENTRCAGRCDKQYKCFVGDTSAEPRVEYPGQFYIAYSGPTLGTALEVGALYIDYSIKFWYPNLNGLPQPEVSIPGLSTTIATSPSLTNLATLIPAGSAIKTALDYASQKGIEIGPGVSTKLVLSPSIHNNHNSDSTNTMSAIVNTILGSVVCPVSSGLENGSYAGTAYKLNTVVSTGRETAATSFGIYNDTSKPVYLRPNIVATTAANIIEAINIAQTFGVAASKIFAVSKMAADTVEYDVVYPVPDLGCAKEKIKTAAVKR